MVKTKVFAIFTCKRINYDILIQIGGMVMGEIYSAEETKRIIANKGLGHFERADDKRYHQFNKDASSLHIKVRKREYALCSTDTDYSNIVAACKKDNCKYIVVNELDRTTINDLVEMIKESEPETIVCIKDGNKIVNPSTAESYIPHYVKFFSNDNLEFVLDVLYQNELNRE